LMDSELVEDAQAILHGDRQIDRINRRMEALAQQCPIAKRLRTIPGFGPTSSAELSGEIGALTRFTSEAGLAVYLGMAPLDRSWRPPTTRQAHQKRKHPLPERTDDLRGAAHDRRTRIARLL
ncbi:MAG: transposase, partial [Salinisphaera sp.]|nr:transposase [Salinisphaera sp.]